MIVFDRVSALYRESINGGPGFWYKLAPGMSDAGHALPGKWQWQE